MTKRIPLVVMTTPKTEWCLPGLFYLLDAYSETLVENDYEVMVCGYDETNRDVLPPYGQFLSIGSFSDYPANKWTDSFLVVLKKLEELGVESFMFMLEDYWPTRGIDVEGIKHLHDYSVLKGDILKIDLSLDRLYSDNRFSHYFNTEFSIGKFDMIRARQYDQYYMSLWCGIFSTKLLLDLVEPGMTAQDLELRGTEKLFNAWRDDGVEPPVVLGTRQGPIMHDNVVHNGSAFSFPSPVRVDRDILRSMAKQGMTGWVTEFED